LIHFYKRKSAKERVRHHLDDNECATNGSGAIPAGYACCAPLL
jgi:hypothetical protein